MEMRSMAHGYVPVKAIAERFGVSVSTVYRLIGDGHLRAVRIGRAVRVPADEVQKLESTGLDIDQDSEGLLL